MFSERFIDLLNAELSSLEKAPLLKPKTRKDWEVGIQQQASGLADLNPSRVIGVTLTPDAPDSAKADVPRGSAEDPVTDIAVCCAEDLLIIEVKIIDVSAEAQVTSQVESICKDLDAEKVSPLCLKWEAIIGVLQDVQEVGRENENSVLQHYLDYLEAHHPEWFPVSPFSTAMSKATALKRIHRLADNCIPLVTSDPNSDAMAEQFGDSAIVPLPSLKYVREFHLQARPEGESFEELRIVLWLGNSIGQSRNFFKENKEIQDSLSWTQERDIEIKGEIFAMEVTPYLKFSHIMGRYVMEAYPSPEEIGWEKKHIREKFLPILSKKWQKKDWPELLKFLLEENPKFLLEPDEFRKSFKEQFETSGRNFVDMALGYEIVVHVPAEKLEKMDPQDTQRFNATGKNDRVALLVKSVIETLRDRIEKRP
ncbi:MAG: hypothetical protein GX256_04175 [Fretibacterium sp.]|nr:hypothetical protein [Fretibacterium sp.]